MENKIEKTGNWFVDQLSLYQNANNDNATVKRNFVVRVSEFELIMSDLRRKKTKDPLQHELLLGRRGSGKSTLLKRIQIEIEEDPTLSKNYIAINLAEEQAGIYRLSDLWFEALKEIALQTNTSLNLESFSTFRDNQQYARYLHGEIHKILVEHQKKAVLLLDNLDRIVENFDDDGHLLRETLLNYNDLQIIGGSTRMDEHFWQYDKPFYEFFRRHRLEGLTFEEIHQLLNQWSDALALPQLKDYALHNRGKIEALRILTDGLPRTLQFFIKIFLKNSTLTGFDHIKQTMDLASPLYQERLNNLTAPQRKIVLEMAFIWEACSTKQLVEACRMEGKLISSFMKQLNGFGIVETLQTNTKNHLYRLSERFFNMWLIVTQGNPDQKRKAYFLTIFLELFYDADEIRALAMTHSQNLKDKSMGYDQAVVLTKAISQSKHIGVDERDELLDLTYQLSDYQSEKGDLPVKYEKLKEEIDKLQEEGKYKEALQIVEEIENEEDGIKFYLKGYFLYRLNDEEEAEKYYIKAVRKGHVSASFNLAFLFLKQGKIEKAEKYYLIAIDRNDNQALYNLANLYQSQNKNEDAEKYYLLSVEKGIDSALFNLANLYYNQEKVEDAEKYYLLAIAKGNIASLHNLAVLYQSQGNQDDAERYYFEALRKGQVESIHHLGILYESQGKIDDAEKYYLDAIEKGDVLALYSLSFLYFKENKNKQKALEYILQKNQIAPDFKSQSFQIIVEIWNGKFDNVDNRVRNLIRDSNEDLIGAFLNILLILEQTHLIQSLFEDEALGQDLRDKYQLLYYATLILNHKTENNLLLRIPQEVMPTVEKIVAEVKEKQAFYAEEAV
jgi:TPR repeat protein